MPNRIAILLALPDAAIRTSVETALEGADYQVSEVVTTCAELRDACGERRPDVIISAVKLEDGDAIEVLIKLGTDCPIPTIIVTARESLSDVERALEDHVMAYLITPIEPKEIQPTVYLVLRRFEQFQALRSEVEDLRQALSDRKLIERAKGIVMGDEGLDEAEAFKVLQKKAMSQRVKLVEAARLAIEAFEQSTKRN